jgi:adenylylsulfate kinase
MKKGNVIWLTGLPCAGKTTIARELEQHLDNCVVLDGDEVRKTISEDLGFSQPDRRKHLIRMAHLAKFLSDRGANVVAAFITPTNSIRTEVEHIVGPKFMLVHVMAEEETCRERDVKGMWAKADAGEIKEFTGVGSPFEWPEECHVSIPTDEEPPHQSAKRVMKFINENLGSALYIGRWQPLHDGHRWLVRQSLDKGVPVTVAVRDMLPDDNNPFSTLEVVDMLLEEFAKEDVEVIVIPNITSVNYGRKVGYEIIEHKPPDVVEKISATKVRKGEE